jgi:protein-S-isoprenylcysteine O-methyltransferase Ste14
MKVRALVGSGDRIGRFIAPFAIVGVILNVAFPSLFEVGGPSEAQRTLSIAVLAVGVTIWIWSVVLILTKVPKGELITTGPFALMKHPLYTGVSLLVLPWLGFLLNTWLGAVLGVVLGVVLYVGSRRYAPEEEADLAARFGPAWDDYRDAVKLPWL